MNALPSRVRRAKRLTVAVPVPAPVPTPVQAPGVPRPSIRGRQPRGGDGLVHTWAREPRASGRGFFWQSWCGAADAEEGSLEQRLHADTPDGDCPACVLPADLLS